MPANQAPQSVPALLKLIAKHGKRSMLVSGVDASGDRASTGKVIIDIANGEPLNEIDINKDKVTCRTALKLGRVARIASGAHGLLRQAASIIANPLVRNRVTFLEALHPE